MKPFICFAFVNCTLLIKTIIFRIYFIFVWDVSKSLSNKRDWMAKISNEKSKMILHSSFEYKILSSGLFWFCAHKSSTFSLDHFDISLEKIDFGFTSISLKLGVVFDCFVSKTDKRYNDMKSKANAKAFYVRDREMAIFIMKCWVWISARSSNFPNKNLVSKMFFRTERDTEMDVWIWDLLINHRQLELLLFTFFAHNFVYFLFVCFFFRFVLSFSVSVYIHWRLRMEGTHTHIERCKHIILINTVLRHCKTQTTIYFIRFCMLCASNV